MADTEKPKGIPSPFMSKAVTSDEIIVEMVNGFSATLATLEKVGTETNEGTLTTYLAGFTSALKALGFDRAESMKLTQLVAEEIIKIGTSDEPCECPNCKNK